MYVCARRSWVRGVRAGEGSVPPEEVVTGVPRRRSPSAPGAPVWWNLSVHVHGINIYFLVLSLK